MKCSFSLLLFCFWLHFCIIIIYVFTCILLPFLGWQKKGKEMVRRYDFSMMKKATVSMFHRKVQEKTRALQK